VGPIFQGFTWELENGGGLGVVVGVLTRTPHGIIIPMFVRVLKRFQVGSMELLKFRCLLLSLRLKGGRDPSGNLELGLD